VPDQQDINLKSDCPQHRGPLVSLFSISKMVQHLPRYSTSTRLEDMLRRELGMVRTSCKRSNRAKRRTINCCLDQRPPVGGGLQQRYRRPLFPRLPEVPPGLYDFGSKTSCLPANTRSFTFENILREHITIGCMGADGQHKFFWMTGCSWVASICSTTPLWLRTSSNHSPTLLKHSLAFMYLPWSTLVLGLMNSRPLPCCTTPSATAGKEILELKKLHTDRMLHRAPPEMQRPSPPETA
jgi:hypothetical protein